MGNGKEEENTSIINELEETLGLSETPLENEDTPASKEEEEEPKEIPVTPNTTTMTDEQLDISKEITKIDIQIEELEKATVDISQFYATLDKELTEEEQDLELTDKPAYMKLVNEKAKEYEVKHSKHDEIQTLKDEKENQEGMFQRQNAITKVITKYPDYNHENILKFFENDLSRAEQKKIYDSSKSYADVYENAYKKHLELNPSNIATTPAPNIPNVNKARQESVNPSQVEQGFKTDEEKISDALGI